MWRCHASAGLQYRDDEPASYRNQHAGCTGRLRGCDLRPRRLAPDGKNLRTPESIRLLPPPPHNPELNPMEKVWDHLRQNKLCATVWNSYEEILDVCKTAWNWLIADPDRIQSIDSLDWATVNV